jgi:predicted TIM-barrel fold metal-dependent hydrolase
VADVPVIDAHINVASTLTIPPEFIDLQAANAFARLEAMGQTVSKSRVADRIHALYQDDLADRLVSEMDGAGIESAVLLAPDFTHVTNCRLNPAELAAHHDEIRRRHPGRFDVFMGVDPRNGEDGVALFEKCVDVYGFRGVKLYPLCGYSASDPRLYPYYEICASRGLTVLCHTGPGWQPLDFSFGQPLLLDAAAKDFPAVNFILAHGGVTHVEEATYMCAFRPNVYLDVSGFVAVLHPDGWARHLNDVFRRGVNHKIVFGTSWPAFKMSTSFKAIMAEVVEGSTVFDGIKNKDRRLILGGNIRRLLTNGVESEAADDGQRTEHRA